MPGTPYRGPWPALTPSQKMLADRLQGHVHQLSHVIGPRNARHYENLCRCAQYLTRQLKDIGYNVHRLPFEADGLRFENLETEGEGPFLLIGAHYDSVWDCPGANDNASGVAGVLELARLLRGKKGFRFALFPNEEPPYYRTPAMGSAVFVQDLMALGEPIRGMLCLETVGYYTQEAGSQRSAWPGMVPDEGDFVALVGDLQSANLAKKLVSNWQEQVPFGCVGLVPTPASQPRLMEAGMAMSDHANFWSAGVPALMVTDTVFYRYDHYHLASDTWEKLTYEPFARMIEGLAQVLLATQSSS